MICLTIPSPEKIYYILELVKLRQLSGGIDDKISPEAANTFAHSFLNNMPSVPISMPAMANASNDTNPLPNILQTPAGLAILEIQGSLNSTLHTEPGANLPIGKLDFPLYDAKAPASDTAWQKRVHLYVGKHQRLTGEVKKLPQAVAVLRKVPGDSADGQALEVAEIIYYKVLFASRPEPVGTTSTE
jgi:chromosome transmission fidelity protein 8